MVLAAVVVCAALALTARRATDAPATSDTAVIESYTLLASQGHLLVGAYSRFQRHHPGPLYFFLLAPFYALSGDRTAGLNAGAAAMSLASMAIVAVVLMGRRPALAVLGCGALALFAVRSAETLASPWNPHVTLLANLAGQAHIALVPCVLVLGTIAFVRASAGAVAATGPRVWRWSIILTVATLLTLWALPLYEQMIGTPRGNITELWHFFLRQARGGQPLAVAVSAWSDMLVGVVRPDFYVAHGWPFVESPVRWAVCVLLLAVAGGAAVWRVPSSTCRRPAGRPVSVEEDWVVMFTPAFRITGREDAVVTIATARVSAP